MGGVKDKGLTGHVRSVKYGDDLRAEKEGWEWRMGVNEWVLREKGAEGNIFCLLSTPASSVSRPLPPFPLFIFRWNGALIKTLAGRAAHESSRALNLLTLCWTSRARPGTHVTLPTAIWH
ncbi:hypothetical protein BgiBS90_009697 [Biomphalaria glabrata]|nr:hypothetical protein BgiBS90_009697 [Biomphalaria glabrata]